MITRLIAEIDKPFLLEDGITDKIFRDTGPLQWRRSCRWNNQSFIRQVWIVHQKQMAATNAWHSNLEMDIRTRLRCIASSKANSRKRNSEYSSIAVLQKFKIAVATVIVGVKTTKESF